MPDARRVLATVAVTALGAFESGCTGTIIPGEPTSEDRIAGAGPTGAGGTGTGGTGVGGTGTGGTGTGGTGAGGSGGTTPTACTASSPAAARPGVRRLTRSEYDSTVRELLGPTAPAIARTFVADSLIHGFDNNDDSPIGATVALQYSAAAESLAAGANVGAIAPCSSGTAEDACAGQFVRTFGKRAYRRPLSEPEVKRLVVGYTMTRQRMGSYADGIRVVLMAMLQSPSFVNHIERGVQPGAGSPVVALSSYEVASRLSYFLWGTMPDDALFAAADRGELATASGVETQAMRMLGAADLAKTKRGVLSFFQQWFDLQSLDDGQGSGVTKDKTLYPAWSSTLRQQMRQETEAFINHVLWDGDAKLTTLLRAPFSFVNDKLASIYGLSGVTGAGLSKRDLDPMRRAGLLTQPGFLALRSSAVLSSPVRRGLFVRERLLCQILPGPPATDPDGEPIDAAPPELDPSKTTREMYQVQLDKPFCRGCHIRINPIGLGFENYDAIGGYRTVDNGKPVDARGELVGTRSIDGPFMGIAELSAKLANAQEVRDCTAEALLLYATGTSVSDLGCQVTKLGAALTATDTDMRKLLVTLVKSDAFRLRRTINAEVCQ